MFTITFLSQISNMQFYVDLKYVILYFLKFEHAHVERV